MPAVENDQSRPALTVARFWRRAALHLGAFARTGPSIRSLSSAPPPANTFCSQFVSGRIPLLHSAVFEFPI